MGLGKGPPCVNKVCIRGYIRGMRDTYGQLSPPSHSRLLTVEMVELVGFGPHSPLARVCMSSQRRRSPNGIFVSTNVHAE